MLCIDWLERTYAIFLNESERERERVLYYGAYKLSLIMDYSEELERDQVWIQESSAWSMRVVVYECHC